MVRLSKEKYSHYNDYKPFLKDVIKSAFEHGYPVDLYQRNDVEKLAGDYGNESTEL